MGKGRSLLRRSAHMPRRNAFKTAANTIDKHLKEFLALQLDVKKKATMLANGAGGGGVEGDWGPLPFRFPAGGPGSKLRAVPGSGGVRGCWPQPPTPLPGPRQAKAGPRTAASNTQSLHRLPGPARGSRRRDRSEAKDWGRTGAGGQGAYEAEAASAVSPGGGVGGRGQACGRAWTLTTPCRRRPRRYKRGWCSAVPRRTPARGPSPGPRPPPLPPPCWLPGRRRRLRREGLDAPRPPLGSRRASRRDRAAAGAAADADRERSKEDTVYKGWRATATRTDCLPD